MRPSITVVLLSLTLLGIFVFYQREKTSTSNPAARPEATIAASNLEADKEMAKYSAPKKPGVMTADAKKQMEEMRERASFLGSTAALLITEEVQRGMVNKAMIRLEQVYQPLFSKWGSTDAERKAVLDIIRGREARLISIRTAAQKEGGNAVLKSIRVIETERAGYAQEISELLGSDKMREFNELDTQDHNRFRVNLPARD
ncbi:MAG TPA: hypothetical protein DDZ88_28425 [Verrucomicrobiales bacterium]|nr:hypothetical protein [Verrucomicrobiales bacterium]